MENEPRPESAPASGHPCNLTIWVIALAVLTAISWGIIVKHEIDQSERFDLLYLPHIGKTTRPPLCELIKFQGEQQRIILHLIESQRERIKTLEKEHQEILSRLGH